MNKTTQLDNAGYPVAAPRQYYHWRGRKIAYYTAGTGKNLLLVHSINAAASAFEMRKPFAALRDTYTVWAIDLLGYGGSDRPPIQYSGQLYAELLADFARDVLGAGAAAFGSSLGAAYLTRAAARNAGLFGPLILGCPTGVRDLAKPAEPNWGYDLLRGPAGDLIYSALASRTSIAYFLREQSYFDRRVVDEVTVEGYYRATRQPGAKYAPICFLTMLLNCDIATDFSLLSQPVQLIWGKQAEITPPKSAQGFLQRNERARLAIIDHARLSVQDEQPDAFVRIVRSFLAETYCA